MPRMTFELQMEGADKIMRILQEASQKNNEMNKSAQDTIKGMNKNVDDIVKNLKTLSDNTSGLGNITNVFRNISSGMREAFGESQTALVRRFGDEIKRVAELKSEYESKATNAKSNLDALRNGTFVGPQRPNEAGLQQAEMAAASLGYNSINNVMPWLKTSEVMTRMGMPNWGANIMQTGLAGGMGGMLASFMSNPASALRMLGGPMTALAMMPMAERMMGRMIVASSFNDAAQTQFGMSLAERAMQGRTVASSLLRSGGGLEGGLETDPGMGDYFRVGVRSATNFLNPFSGTFFSRTASGEKAYREIRQQYREADEARFAYVDRASQMRLALGEEMDATESAFGFDFAGRRFSQFAGVGGRRNAIRAMEILTGAGGQPQFENAAMADLLQNYGMTEGVAGLYANRQAGGFGSAGSESAFLGRLGGAGLGGNDSFVSRQLLGNFISQSLGPNQSGYFSPTTAFGAADTFMAGAGGMNIVQQQAGLGTVGAQFQGMGTPFDMRRMALMESLAGMGLSGKEASVFANMISAGGMSPETLGALSKRTGIGAGQLRSTLGAGFRSTVGAMTSIMGAGMDETAKVLADQVGYTGDLSTFSAALLSNPDPGQAKAQAMALQTDPFAAQRAPGAVEDPTATSRRMKDKASADVESEMIRQFASSASRMASALEGSVSVGIQELVELAKKWDTERSGMPEPHKGPRK